MKKKIFPSAGTGSFSKPRFFFLIVIFLFGFLSLYYRSFYLHVIPDRRLERLTKQQYQARLEHVAPRGNIYDGRGEELAVSVATDSVALRPPRVKDRAGTITALSKILGISKQEASEKVNAPKKYLWVKRNLSPEQSKELKQLNLPGIEFVKEAKRFYPNRELASQILGAVGRDGEGLGGLEMYYEAYLRGDSGDSSAFRDARGKTFQTDESVNRSDDFSHLHLTIQKNIQYTVETELEDTCKTYHAKACTAVVMDPRTGALLAMASYPHFNPNQYGSYDLSLWKNLAVTDSFEPGSIFKVILSAAALESGFVKPEDRFFCENGNLKIGSHTIHDHGSGYGLLSFRDILKVSSNIGTYKVAQKIGKAAFAKVVEDFGFGNKVGIDYPGEAAGQVRPVATWQDIDFANMAFGQGIGTTPLQITTAFSTIAAGGVRMRPYLVSKIVDAENRILWEAEPTLVKRVISGETAHVLTGMMEGVTTEGGTGTRATLPGYSVAGKTGTAQKIANGAYSHRKFMSSFIGFVPTEQPRLTILVTVDEPQGQVYGGQVAAPAFRRIAWSALRELGISPSPVRADPSAAPQEKNPVVQASVVPWSLPQWEQPPPLTPPPAGEVSKTVVRPPATTAETFLVPDFSGMSMRQVLRKLDQTGLTVRLNGSGVAVAQQPLPGTAMRKGGICAVTFKRYHSGGDTALPLKPPSGQAGWDRSLRQANRNKSDLAFTRSLSVGDE